MTSPIRQATETYVEDARARALRVVAGGWFALVVAFASYLSASTQLARGFVVAALAAATLLSIAEVSEWWRRTQIARELFAGRAAEELRARVDRSTAWLRRAQNFGLALGVAIVIAAVRIDGELAAGLAFGMVVLLIVEQVLDHTAEERAQQYVKTLDVSR